MPEFHIHADLHEPCPQFEEFLASFKGFYPDPFVQCESGVVTFTPRLHYTFKTNGGRFFRSMWKIIESFLDREQPAWKGYLEAEALFGSRTRIPSKSFDSSVPLPFTTTKRPLEPGKFRQNELHIYFDDAKTDPRIKELMLKIGFFPAWCEMEGGGIEGIWTIQAVTIDEIVAIRPAVTEFLTKAGGSFGCYIDEERVVYSRMSHPDVALAPVIDQINWR